MKKSAKALAKRLPIPLESETHLTPSKQRERTLVPK